MFQNSMKQRMNWEDFYGPNLGYALELYDQYTQDPNSIDPDLKEMFDELGAPPSDIKEALGNKRKGTCYSRSDSKDRIRSQTCRRYSNLWPFERFRQSAQKG